MIRRHGVAELALAALTLTGCWGGGDEGPPRVPTFPVSGIVHINGQPTPGVQVYLYPGDQPGNIQYDPNLRSPHQGMTDAQGKFQIMTYVQNDGAPAGDYHLGFFWIGKSVGEIQLIPDEPTVDREAQAFNRKYSDPNLLKMKVTVKEGQPTDLGTLDLKTK